MNLFILPSTLKDLVVAWSICHTEEIVINAHQRALRFLKAAINWRGKTSDKWHALGKTANISLMHLQKNSLNYV